ncbi:hypothetical protein PN498_27630 [Oscillatoria sp. CS-180]|uniref:hypothetical protein n=1 Tax=Oscillatoria sp. CS-180 TaxID=3021720 RepID=UPI00232DF0E8|nr:hypothetical protein [Oscillatoria sp. CS-180]MDB9529789.1 hypothetical protein [Oscillatoria sp. CS-180]
MPHSSETDGKSPRSLKRLISRESYIKDVEEAVEGLGRHNRNILVYYGPPSITWDLAKNVYRSLKAQGYACALLDGVGLERFSTPSLEEGLQELRRELGASGVDCSCYDIAYWCYWAARHPGLAVDSTDFSQRMQRADNASAFADLVGAVQDLDLSKVLKQMQLADMTETARALIPHMMTDIARYLEGAIPFGIFLAKLNWFFVGLDEQRRIWWKERGNRDLRELKEDCDGPLDIAPKLPLFLARD